MKFIGPRPAIPSQKKLIESRLVLGIYNLYPGVTGLAQVNGRDNINDDDWGIMRTFQATEFQKHEGLEISVHKIRKY
mgnify:CR=1 FL=1